MQWTQDTHITHYTKLYIYHSIFTPTFREVCNNIPGALLGTCGCASIHEYSVISIYAIEI